MNDVIYAGKNALTLNVAQHVHESWELIYCTSGTGQFVFGNSSINYNEGDIVVIPPHTYHSNVSLEGFTNIHINLLDATLPFKTPLIIKDDNAKHIFNAFNDTYYYFYSNLEKRGLPLSSLGSLIANYMLAYQEESPISEIVNQIETNILENFADSYYDLNEYLDKFPFSRDYLRKLFKSELGITPNQYLINKRLQTSAEFLTYLYSGNHNINTEYNISYVAAICGFTDPLYFSRMFKKKYKESPSNYAKKIQAINKEKD